MKYSLAKVALLSLLVGLVAWSPWVSDAWAKDRTVVAFTAVHSQIMDGCGFSCKGCGPTGTRKAAFGRYVSIEFACGMRPTDLPENHLRQEVFVSAIGTVHGVPGN